MSTCTWSTKFLQNLSPQLQSTHVIVINIYHHDVWVSDPTWTNTTRTPWKTWMESSLLTYFSDYRANHHELEMDSLSWIINQQDCSKKLQLTTTEYSFLNHLIISSSYTNISPWNHIRVVHFWVIYSSISYLPIYLSLHWPFS